MDFIKKLFVPDVLLLRVKHTIELVRLQADLAREVAIKAQEVMSQNEKQERMVIQTVLALSGAIDAKDSYTNSHSARVADYSREIAKRAGLSETMQNDIYIMGLLHDMGKIGISDTIINKPSKLMDEGYPDGIAGEEIPAEARIIAVADAYDAMSFKRSYRGDLPQAVVRSEVEKGKGTQFDPAFAEIMLSMIDEDADYQMRKGRQIMEKKGHFTEGLKDGVPIALGYLSVSFSVGIIALASGINVFQGALMSLTNVTSAGQFAGIAVIASGGTLLELILTQLIINLRYALMSLSLSQKLPEKMPLWQRMIVAFANTDEIFAVAMGHAKSLTFSYMVGLQILPILGWTGGTVLGAIAGQVLPPAIGSALSVALYGMFIAVVVPVAVKVRSVLWVAVLAVLFSCVIYYVPLFSGISTGISIIICTILASVTGALLFPIPQETKEKEV